MDFLLDYPLIDPTNDNYPFNFSLLAFQAKQLLTQLGWTYYTIWKADTTHNFPGMAGEAFASGQYRWASGEEVLVQIRFLSRQNQQPTPLELMQALPLLKTVVCIPLRNGAGVLEIGTKELVPESDGMISQILRLIDGLAITQGTSRGEQIMSASFEAGTKVLQNDVGNQYGDPDEQCKSTSIKEIYGDRAIFRRPSNSSSYMSPSSTASSSTPSAGDQMGNSSNTTFVLSTMNNEDGLMSPASYLQATPKSMVKSFDEVNILKQLDHMDMQDVSKRISLQDFDSYRLDNGDLNAPSQFSGHDHHLHLSDLSLYFSSRDVVASPPLLSLTDSSRYAEYPYSDGNTDNSYLLDYMLQPMQCTYSVSNEQVDAHIGCLNEIVGGPSKEPNMECQTTSSCNQLQVASIISCLPSETFQASNHSASYSNDDQQQQWRCMFPGVNEGEGMTALFAAQSERNTHAMVSTGISKFPLADYSLADKRLEANKDHNIDMPEQGAAIMIENEGSTSKNTRLNRGILSSTNAEAYEALIHDHKLCTEQGEKMVVSSTVPFTTQAAAGSYVSYASGSAEVHDKVEATGGYDRYASRLAKVDAYASLISEPEGSYVSYTSGSAEDYKVVVATSAPSQLAAGGSYASYSASGSAEAEKVVGSSTVLILSSQGANGRRAGDQYRQVQQQGVELQKLQDDHFTNYIGRTPHDSNTNFDQQHDNKTEHHKYAERDRRRKHGHCIDTLRTLVPNIAKKDPKTTILERTIQHLKELKYRICELQQENQSKDQRKSAKDSNQCVSNSQHATNVKSSTQNISSQENATCHYIHPSSVQMPHFQLNLIKNIQDVKANATIIEILNSLQNKNLCCYKIDYEFCKNNNKLFVDILANYKDGGIYSQPTSDEIQSIKEWWERLIKE